MALSPQELPAGPSDVPLSAPAGKSWFRRYVVTRQFLFWSIALHLLFGAGAAVYVAQRIVTRHDPNFTASPPSANPSTHAQEHKVQMAQKQKTMSAPAQMKRITTAAPDTRVALPSMPAMPSLTSSLSPTRMAGMGGNGLGLGMGGGTGTGATGRGGPVSLFGLRSSGGGSLVGTFYDLKQTVDGKPTPMTGNPSGPGSDPVEKPANDEASKLVARFASGGFNDSTLSPFFKGPNPLYATQIFIPSLPADRGPKEFGLEDKVKPRRWLVVYRGRVSPPETGRYRFVGTADDYLVVRVNSRVVLDGSANHPTLGGKKPAKEYKYDRVQFAATEGEYFDASAGDRLELGILIGEQPGGNYNTYLMIQKDGVEYAKDGNGNPILPIFKIAKSENNFSDGPPVAADTPWSVWRAEK